MSPRVVAAVVTAAAFLLGPGLASSVAAPSDPAALRNRAAAYLDNGEDAKAIDAFKDLVRRFPDSVPDRVNLAIALLNHNDLDGAEAELRAALEKDANDLRAHYNLGLVFKHRGKNDEAAKELALVAASREGQTDATVFYNLGILFRRLRKSDEALTALEKAVALRPEHASAHFQLYNTLVQKGDRAAAQPELEQFKFLQKATPEFQQNEAYLERGVFTKIDAPGPREAGAASPASGAKGPVSAQIRFEVTSLVGPPKASPMPERPEPQVVTPEMTRLWKGLAAALGDFDGDGVLDVAVATTSGSVRIYRRQAASGFTQVLATLEAFKGARDTKPEHLSTWALASADIDNDGDVDLLIASENGIRLQFNDGKGRFVDGTKKAGLAETPGASSAVWFDADRDGDLDLALGQQPRTSVMTGSGEPKTLERAPPRLFLNAGLFPGDAKNIASVARKTEAPFDTARFIAADKEASFVGGVSIVAADLRGRGDPDLLMLDAPDSASGIDSIGRNLRGGRFHQEGCLRGTFSRMVMDIAAAPQVQAADLDGDGYPDVLSKDPTEVLVHWNDGTGSCPVSPRSLLSVSTGILPSHGAPELPAATLLDADGDGLLDVAALLVDRSPRHDGPADGDAGKRPSGTRLALLHNEGGRRFSTLAAIGIPGEIDGPAGLLAGDLDGDGDPDLAVVTPDAPPIVLANVTKTTNRFLKVSLKGGKTNRAGVGAKVEVHADRLFVGRESDGNPVIVGIGPRGRADSVRIVWTSGVTQDLVDVPAGSVKIEEKREFSGSCPFLYVGDGSQFRFASEALSGAPIGFLRPDGAYEAPRPTEHLRLPPGTPVARDGRLSLRMTEEMRELTALDSVRLVAVDHPESVEVYSNERLTEKVEPFRYVAVADLRSPGTAQEITLGSTPPPATVHGSSPLQEQDPAEALSMLDGRPAAGFTILGPRLEGLAEPHALVMRFDAPGGSAQHALVLDGWLAWTTSDTSRALLQAHAATEESRTGLDRAATREDARSDDVQDRAPATSMQYPAADARTFAGRPIPPAPEPWGPSMEVRRLVGRDDHAATADVAVVPDVGLPIGASMVAPLPDLPRFGRAPRTTRDGESGSTERLEVRIGTSLAIYYDRIRLGTIVDAPLAVRELRPIAADLRWRGVASERRAADPDPTLPDYDVVSPLSPFPRFEGGTTPPGDARELVSETDGRFVIFGTGEEVALDFDATALTPPAPGMARTWFLVSTGYARDGDPNTKPLPWGTSAQ